MILGLLRLDLAARVLHTHRDSYLIDDLSVVSVRRPLLAGGVLFGAGLAGFALRFHDLLFRHEMVVLIVAGLLALLLGLQLGQLRLLSRDLRGSPLGDVIWGRYATLNRHRVEIVQAIRGADKKGR